MTAESTAPVLVAARIEMHESLFSSARRELLAKAPPLVGYDQAMFLKSC